MHGNNSEDAFDLIENAIGRCRTSFGDVKPNI